MITSAHFEASATDSTRSPAAFALSADLLPGCSPTATSTPLSWRFSACACPCEPYPMTATFRYHRFLREWKRNPPAPKRSLSEDPLFAPKATDSGTA